MRNYYFLNLIVLAMLILAACSSATPAPTTITQSVSPTQPPPASPTVLPITTQASPTAAATSTPIPVEVVWNIKGDPNPFDHPTNLAVDQQDNLYVVDAGNDRIQKFDNNGKFIMMWGASGAGDREFDFARGNGDYLGGVAMDVQGNIYVVDSGNQRIQKFDPSGNFILKWGSEGTNDGQFMSPVDAAIDGQGNIYVIDDRRNDVQKFDPNGNFLLKFGGERIFNPGGLAVDEQGNVYVAGFQTEQIEKFDSDGKFLKSWGSVGSGDNQFDSPCDVAVDAQGNVYVANFGYSLKQPRIQKFDSDGKFLIRWGRRGADDGEFLNACGIAVDSKGNVYVADYENNNVQKFRLK
jgi:DNA-binding beta-propeller fold protein YncE